MKLREVSLFFFGFISEEERKAKEEQQRLLEAELGKKYVKFPFLRDFTEKYFFFQPKNENE